MINNMHFIEDAGAPCMMTKHEFGFDKIRINLNLFWLIENKMHCSVVLFCPMLSRKCFHFFRTQKHLCLSGQSLQQADIKSLVSTAKVLHTHCVLRLFRLYVASFANFII